MKRILFAVVLLGIVGSGALCAQEDAKSAKEESRKKITAEEEQAAYRLFEALKLREGIRSALDNSLNVQLKRMPAMAPYKDIYQRFFDKYTQWDDMKKELAKAYASQFSAKELDELAKFYSTPLGQKSLTVLPRLTQLTMILAQKRIAAHAKELKAEIEKRARTLEKENKQAE